MRYDGSSVIAIVILLFLSGRAGNAQPVITLDTRAFDSHVELNWSIDDDSGLERYRIYRAGASGTFTSLGTTSGDRRIDFTGHPADSTAHFRYFIAGINAINQEYTYSDTLDVGVKALSDSELLDMVQEYTFRYFWDFAHPVSGLARERNTSGDIVTIGGSGFGIMAILVGIERGFITREEGLNRILKIVSFLQIADRYHGVFPHWMDGNNGNTVPFGQFDDGGDLVETAFLMQGLLCARQYFNRDDLYDEAVRQGVTALWEDVEWNWYQRNDSDVLYWHWSPNFGWQMNFPIRGYNEALIVYLLAIASPTHAVSADLWHTGWAGLNYTNGLSWYGYKLWVGPPAGGPLFFAHYSYLGFDPRNIRDQYANYFDQNINHTLINRAYCIDNPIDYAGYSDVCWGLTASDDPFGYLAHAPGAGTDNGTITPTAALSSMPYTPEESIAALKHFYREHGDRLWGEMGFYDAFNLEENWFADSYLAIDQGPIVCMIENFRSRLLWDLFMSNPEIAPALDAIGFEDDITSISQPASVFEAALFPSPTDGLINIDIQVKEPGECIIEIFTIDGKRVYFERNYLLPENEHLQLRLHPGAIPAGLNFLTLTVNDYTKTLKFIIRE